MLLKIFSIFGVLSSGKSWKIIYEFCEFAVVLGKVFSVLKSETMSTGSLEKSWEHSQWGWKRWNVSAILRIEQVFCHNSAIEEEEAKKPIRSSKLWHLVQHLIKRPPQKLRQLTLEIFRFSSHYPLEAHACMHDQVDDKDEGKKGATQHNIVCIVYIEEEIKMPMMNLPALVVVCTQCMLNKHSIERLSTLWDQSKEKEAFQFCFTYIEGTKNTENCLHHCARLQHLSKSSPEEFLFVHSSSSNRREASHQATQTGSFKKSMLKKKLEHILTHVDFRVPFTWCYTCSTSKLLASSEIVWYEYLLTSHSSKDDDDELHRSECGVSHDDDEGKEKRKKFLSSFESCVTSSSSATHGNRKLCVISHVIPFCLRWLAFFFSFSPFVSLPHDDEVFAFNLRRKEMREKEIWARMSRWKWNVKKR